MHAYILFNEANKHSKPGELFISFTGALFTAVIKCQNEMAAFILFLSGWFHCLYP